MLINASLINSYNIDRFCHNLLCLKIEESVKSVISLLNKRVLRYVVHYFNCRVTVFSYHIVEAKTGDALRIRDLSSVEWGGVSFVWLSKTSLATFLHIFSCSVTIKIKRDPTCVCVRAWPLWYILPMISTCICYNVIIVFHSMTCYRNFIYPLSLLIMFIGRYCNDII